MKPIFVVDDHSDVHLSPEANSGPDQNDAKNIKIGMHMLGQQFCSLMNPDLDFIHILGGDDLEMWTFRKFTHTEAVQ
ncbi:hypothetical protein JTB14_001017 [Gonioctena quinquepunctata]|nr:hypothetical protein JTB14_001017 [Gonioctena quinquepunctata]